MAFPKWPARLRSGAPPTDGVSPADPELFGLLSGQRSLIKRECLNGRDADVAERWLAARALSLRRIPAPAPDGQTVILAARDSDALHRGEVLELEARRRDPSAVVALGRLLGYPACCIERFCSLSVQDDVALLGALLDGDTAAAPPETLWLVGPLSLISHAPCSLRCAASASLGADLLAALDTAYPGYATRWQELARRVHVMSSTGGALLSLRVFNQHIEHAVRWQVPDADAAAHADAPELAGAAFDASAYSFVADHRG
ncbi:MAG TPA: hypothetical protein PKD61_10500 [Polyangiaceae bacterium]|nr:hypothetical protein [Polyangiaceae bacterium]